MNKNLQSKILAMLEYTVQNIKRSASGSLRHDYLVPAGPYEEQWDWDAFFMCGALAAVNSQDAIYFKNWALNYLENAGSDGKVPGCITPRGADPRLNQMKPLLAQGVLLASRYLDDFAWIVPNWERLNAICLYRERELWSTKYDLAVWYDSMESGADNNPAALDFPPKSVVACDANAFVYREYLALSEIAAQLKNSTDSQRYKQRAQDIYNNFQKACWDKEAQIFFNVNTLTGEFIPRVSYSCFVPLWAGMATQEQAQSCITRYMLSEDHLKSDFGLRTLSKSDPDYNNVNMIKPHSNWQGPVWPIANYLYAHALLRYGFQQEAMKIAEAVAKIVIADIEQSGGMHENYDAETGEPLAAPNFISWNILLRNLLPEIETGRDPFRI